MIKSTDVMSKELNNQVNVVNTTIESFTNILNELNENAPRIKEINNSAISINLEKNNILQKIEQTSAASEEISASSQEIVASSEELMSSTEEVASTSQKLDNMTSLMIKEVNKFKIK